MKEKIAKWILKISLKALGESEDIKELKEKNNSLSKRVEDTKETLNNRLSDTNKAIETSNETLSNRLSDTNKAIETTNKKIDVNYENNINNLKIINENIKESYSLKIEVKDIDKQMSEKILKLEHEKEKLKIEQFNLKEKISGILEDNERNIGVKTREIDKLKSMNKELKKENKDLRLKINNNRKKEHGLEI